MLEALSQKKRGFSISKYQDTVPPVLGTVTWAEESMCFVVEAQRKLYIILLVPLVGSGRLRVIVFCMKSDYLLSKEEKDN